MLKFGNKEFRNLQEQVAKNMQDISSIKAGTMVLDEFGIKVVGQESSVANMPTVEDYKENNPDWEYGDAYAIGEESPYEIYILTRANGTHVDDYWFKIGEFPAVGPQGPQGIQGETGPQGQTGPSGANGSDAGFGTVSATATTLEPGEDATVSVTASGPNTAKEFSFTFGIPEGQPGQDASCEWGAITGDITDQLDLVGALQGKQNTLVSGTNIKTINNTSLLGSGNISVNGAQFIEYGDTTINVPALLAAVRAGTPIIVTDGDEDVQYYYLKDVVTNTGDTQIDMYFTTEFMNGLRTAAYISQTGFHYASGTVTWTVPEVIDISGGGGGILDVLVNNTSVVSQDIAYVTVPTKVSDLTNDRGYITSNALNGYAKTADLATVATSGSYNDLSNKPSIPSKTSDLTNDSGFITGITSSMVTTALGYTPGTSNFSGAYADLTGKPDLSIYAETSDLATVAFSGSYSDLSNKPSIPTKTSDLTNDSGFIASNEVVENQANTVIVVDATHNISGKSLSAYTATETTIGGYTVIQIKKNGAILSQSDAKSYMAAQTGSEFLPVYDYDNPTYTYFIFANGKIYKPQFDSTNGLVLYYMNQLAYKADIPTVPTKTSDLTNDSGFITNSVSNLTNYYDKEDVDEIVDLVAADIPTNTSDLTNDSGFITSSALTGYAYLANGTAVAKQEFTGWNSFAHSITVKPSDSTAYMEYAYNQLNKHTSAGDTYGIVVPNKSGTIALTSDIPTNVSDLNNDSGYITSSDIPVTDVTVGGTSVVSSGVAVIPAIPDTTYMVTTNTAQTITADKSIATSAKLKFLDSSSVSKAQIYLDDLVDPSDPDELYIEGESINLHATSSAVVQGDEEVYLSAGDSGINIVCDGASTAAGAPIAIDANGGAVSVSGSSFTYNNNQVATTNQILGSSTETWTFTLSDGTTTTKTIVLG